MRFVVTIVVLVGILSILSDILKIHASAAEHEESFWQDLPHLFAGILCINIMTFARLFGQSAGSVVAELFEALFRRNGKTPGFPDVLRNGCTGTTISS